MSWAGSCARSTGTSSGHSCDLPSLGDLSAPSVEGAPSTRTVIADPNLLVCQECSEIMAYRQNEGGIVIDGSTDTKRTVRTQAESTTPSAMACRWW